jgi:hypothetical protein
MAELVDAPDLKSCFQSEVWVRFPLVPPYAGIAQLIERFTCNEDVVGLNPTTGSIGPKEVTHLNWFWLPHIIDQCVVAQ